MQGIFRALFPAAAIPTDSVYDPGPLQTLRVDLVDEIHEKLLSTPRIGRTAAYLCSTLVTIAIVAVRVLLAFLASSHRVRPALLAGNGVEPAAVTHVSLILWAHTGGKASAAKHPAPAQICQRSPVVPLPGIRPVLAPTPWQQLFRLVATHAD